MSKKKKQDDLVVGLVVGNGKDGIYHGFEIGILVEVIACIGSKIKEDDPIYECIGIRVSGCSICYFIQRLSKNDLEILS